MKIRQHFLLSTLLFLCIAIVILYGILRYSFVREVGIEEERIMEHVGRGELRMAEDLSNRLIGRITLSNHLFLSNLQKEVTEYKKEVIEALLFLEAIRKRVVQIQDQVDFDNIDATASSAEILLSDRNPHIDTEKITESVRYLETRLGELGSCSSDLSEAMSKLTKRRQAVSSSYAAFREHLVDQQGVLRRAVERFQMILERRSFVIIRIGSDLSDLERNIQANEAALQKGRIDVGPWDAAISKLDTQIKDLSAIEITIANSSDIYSELRTEVAEHLERLRNYVKQMREFQERREELRVNRGLLEKMNVSNDSETRYSVFLDLRRNLLRSKARDSKNIWQEASRQFELEIKPSLVSHFDHEKAKEIREKPGGYMTFDESLYFSINVKSAFEKVEEADGVSEKEIGRLRDLALDFHMRTSGYPLSLSSFHFAARRCLREIFSAMIKLDRCPPCDWIRRNIGWDPMGLGNVFKPCEDMNNAFEEFQDELISRARRELTAELESNSKSPF